MQADLVDVMEYVYDFSRPTSTAWDCLIPPDKLHDDTRAEGYEVEVMSA